MAIKTLLISCLLLASGVSFNSIQAQMRNPTHYVGVEAMYGVRLLTISSDISEISQLNVIEESGSLGALFGNEFIRTTLRIVESDYAAQSYSRTVKLFRSEAQVNFYPFQYIRTHRQIMDVYILGGLSWDAIKFYGHDLSQGHAPINYSNPKEPYIGKVTQYSGSIGLGVEYHVPYVSSFMHLFAEIKYGSPLLVNSDNELLSGTSIGTFSAVTLGISFGAHR